VDDILATGGKRGRIPEFWDGRAADRIAILQALAGIGDIAEVRATIERYREAGTTLPVLGPFAGHEGAAGFEATLEALAA